MHAEEENVVSVFANTKNKLHTTRSWDFLGMKETISRRPKSESSIIVGMMDTGKKIVYSSCNAR